MASAEGGMMESPKAPGVKGIVSGVLPHPTRGSGKHLEIPSGNSFRRILKATERSFLHLYMYAAVLYS